VAPVGADEFTDVVEGALEAYRDGDLDYAREELDYAMRLLVEMKSESLSGFLPEPLPGWTREQADADGGGFAMMLGGGTSATATYRRDGAAFKVTLVANSPMVSSIGAVITGMASMGGAKPLRIQRTRFASSDGELQGVIDNRVLVSASGDAALEDIIAHLETMDFRALGEF
jgi:hypothetical protein